MPAGTPSGGPSGPVPTVKALNCPGCGAALTIRAFEHTLTVVCVQCLAVLDAKDPNLKILQQFEESQRVTSRIPLGVRGKWRGDVYEVIGFQVRTIQVEGVPYSWSEYLLFNPFKGFRYLTEYNGHWNDVKTLKALPEPDFAGSKLTMKLLGERYVHFQTAKAATTYVMGEFPWRVRVGETAEVVDFVRPPRILSRETTGSETVWSLGEYTDGARVWESFKLPGRPPAPVGVFANQPSPFEGRVKDAWKVCLFLLMLLLALAAGFYGLARQEEVFSQRYSFSRWVPAPSSFVTRVFELQGRPSNVELSIRTNLRENWAYFNFALINQASGEAYDFGREVSNYSGEGSPNDEVRIPSVPPGRYYLRVEPEMSPSLSTLNYELQLRRDVPSVSFFLIAGLLLLLPPVALMLRSATFEKSRWQESSYATSTAKSDSDDEDDDE